VLKNQTSQEPPEPQPPQPESILMLLVSLKP
jgi:hypothetical protein